MVFVVRTIKHSFLSRAGNLTYIAFFAAQIAATLISVFGFNGYDFPPDPIEDCQFCKLAYNSNGVYNGYGTNPFFAKKEVPVYNTESVYTASGELACTGVALMNLFCSFISNVPGTACHYCCSLHSTRAPTLRLQSLAAPTTPWWLGSGPSSGTWASTPSRCGRGGVGLSIAWTNFEMCRWTHLAPAANHW